MSDLCGVAEVAERVLSRIVDKVCGSCERNCCHQGTMMGAQDLRRLVRGLALDPALPALLREGLAEKAAEIAADVKTARQVLRLAEASGSASEADLAEAARRVDALEALGRELETGLPLDYEHLQRLLLHTALRHNVIRAFRAFPAGDGALARFAGPESTFRFRHSRLAPPRCVFHSLTRGCLAGSWKPAKCANFFCIADPSLLDAIREHMDFDDFVLANFDQVDRQGLLAVLRAEVELGPAYHEPLVVAPMGPEQAADLVEGLTEMGLTVGYEELLLPPSAKEADALSESVPEGEARVVWVRESSATDLYDLAIGLDRVRLRGSQRLIVFAVGELVMPSVPPHKLWDNHTIAQPVGYLECYVLKKSAPAGQEEGAPLSREAEDSTPA